MAQPTALRADAMASTLDVERFPTRPLGAAISGVSWGAILAGAAGAAALSLILLIVGTGLGLSAISPWTKDGIGAQTFTVSAIVWVAVTQLLAAALGGYLAGRLRGQWLDVQADEVYFRDTAHGFLAWAIAALTSAVMLSAAIGSIVGTGIGAGAQATAGIAKAGAELAPTNYVIESLFRQPPAATPGVTAAPVNPTSDRAAVTAEVTGIFMNTLRSGDLQPEDRRYVSQLVAQRTGLSEAQAAERVRDGYTRAQTALRNAETTAREAADKARKASATTALWLFISLLAGAFVASLSATFGGRQRDL